MGTTIVRTDFSGSYARAASLSTRTDATRGVLTFTAAHLIVVDDLIDITWGIGDKSRRFTMLVTAVTTTSPFTANFETPTNGGGDDLPAEDDPVTVRLHAAGSRVGSYLWWPWLAKVQAAGVHADTGYLRVMLERFISHQARWIWDSGSLRMEFVAPGSTGAAICSGHVTNNTADYVAVVPGMFFLSEFYLSTAGNPNIFCGFCYSVDTRGSSYRHGVRIGPTIRTYAGAHAEISVYNNLVQTNVGTAYTGMVGRGDFQTGSESHDEIPVRVCIFVRRAVTVSEVVYYEFEAWMQSPSLTRSRAGDRDWTLLGTWWTDCKYSGDVKPVRSEFFARYAVTTPQEQLSNYPVRPTHYWFGLNTMVDGVGDFFDPMKTTKRTCLPKATQELIGCFFHKKADDGLLLTTTTVKSGAEGNNTDATKAAGGIYGYHADDRRLQWSGMGTVDSVSVGTMDAVPLGPPVTGAAEADEFTEYRTMCAASSGQNVVVGMAKQRRAIYVASGANYTKVSASVGTVVVSGGHLFLATAEAIDLATVTWSGGSRTGMSVLKVDGTTCTITGGSGNDLPDSETEVTVTSILWRFVIRKSVNDGVDWAAEQVVNLIVAPTTGYIAGDRPGFVLPNGLFCLFYSRETVPFWVTSTDLENWTVFQGGTLPNDVAVVDSGTKLFGVFRVSTNYLKYAWAPITAELLADVDHLPNWGSYMVPGAGLQEADGRSGRTYLAMDIGNSELERIGTRLFLGIFDGAEGGGGKYYGAPPQGDGTIDFKGTTRPTRREFRIYYSDDNGQTWIAHGTPLVTGGSQAINLLTVGRTLLAAQHARSTWGSIRELQADELGTQLTSRARGMSRSW